MNYQLYSEEVLKRLSPFGFYQEENNEETLIVLKSRSSSDDSAEEVFFTLFLRINTGRKLVYGQPKVLISQKEIDDEKKLEDIVFRNNDNGSRYSLAMILKLVEEATSLFGFGLRTEMPPSEENGKGFESKTSSQNRAIPKAGKEKSKKGILISVVAIILVIIIAAIMVMMREKPDDNPDGSGDISNTSSSTSSSISTEDSSEKKVISSEGVDDEDIANILSNQFYFVTEDKIFYSCSNNQNEEHIYVQDKKDKSVEEIFDGFGWNLVVVDDWLYFTGNPGMRLDASYNMYRVKIDGSSYEKLNDRYSYGLFFYGDDLFYLERDVDYETSFHLKKMNPETKKSEELYRFCKNVLIYNKRIYLIDNSGNLLTYTTDMKEPKVLVQADIKMFTISQNKIIYIDHNNNVKICDIDGSNLEIIREQKDENDLYALNTNQGKIFFVESNKNSFDHDIYGYKMDVISLDFAGKNEKGVYSYYSVSAFLNIVNNRVLTFEQKRSATNSDVTAMKIVSSNLNGGDSFTLES